MIDRNDVCDYIIVKVKEAGVGLNHLKLQKLMYYVQAWNLAFRRTALFEGKFQAWVHGPVNREIYDRFAPKKSLYSEIQDCDARLDFDPESLDEGVRLHIDAVLEAYADFSGSQLEEMTHREPPWIEAREGYRPSQRCEVVIDENRMRDYYRSLIPTAG